MCYGVINLAHHDTTPGAKSPLAPPAGWNGDDEAYLALMRHRYQSDPGVRQHLALAARIYADISIKDISVTGPYQGAALKVLKPLVGHD